MTSQLSVLNKIVLFLTRSEPLMRKINLEAAITLKPSSCPGSAWSPSTVWCVRENQHLQSLGWRFPTPACLSFKEKQNDHSQYTFCLSSLFQMLSASSPLQVCLGSSPKDGTAQKYFGLLSAVDPAPWLNCWHRGHCCPGAPKAMQTQVQIVLSCPPEFYLGIQIGNLQVYTLILKLNGDL
ncbi:Hypothetical predicted protein [Marmota monax]|uniref:Uncharacterized protein n=1 Tax=Marmota monax TaxID=9995 RepID=A0A5E4ACA9_MARMO|nr:hypothetical protein GHT09_002967 [Marmota monax]VTJ54679.1 Hypothetical predicted protein [Marmota monax]